MVVIVDIVDHNRVMVVGENVTRQQMTFTQIAITPILAKVPRGARSATVKKAFKAQVSQLSNSAIAHHRVLTSIL